MDHIKILKRAFHITINYRALWIFGVLLALTTSGRGGGGNGGGAAAGGGGGSFLPSRHLADFRFPTLTAQAVDSILSLIIVLSCLFFFLFLAFVILRYVSETALIRMVDRYETADEKVSLGAGFRLGWSRPALRILLIDLVFGVAGMVVFLLLMLIAGVPLLVWLTDIEAVQIAGTIISTSLFMLLIFLAIAAAIILSLLLQFMRRACVLENLGVFEAIRRGVAVFRQRLGDAIIMGIILFALGMVFVVLVIPLSIMLIMVAAVLGSLPGLLVGWLTSLFAEGVWPWIAGAVVAAPIFLLVVFIPLLFVGGLFEVYKSSAWTLTYREITALERIQLEGSPLDTPGLDTA